MTHSIRVNFKSALVGVAIALVAVIAMGQLSVSRATTPTAAIMPGYGIGNPHPRDMVQFVPPNGLGTGAQIQTDEFLEVYSVPPDKWLVLVAYDSLAGIAGPNIEPSNGWILWEDLGGVLTAKSSTSSSHYGVARLGSEGGCIGWTFAPGSKVLLQNKNATTVFSYNLQGYLTGL